MTKTSTKPSLPRRPPQALRIARHRKPVLPPPLLYSREQTAAALGGVSTMTVIRLEQAGLLDPIKLAGSRNGHTFYAVAQVHALAAGQGASNV